MDGKLVFPHFHGALDIGNKHMLSEVRGKEKKREEIG